MHARTIIFTAGIALGIVAGFTSPLASEIAIASLVLGLAQCVVSMIGKKKRATGSLLSLPTALFAFALAIGIVRVQLIEEKIPIVCEQSCTMIGTIVTSPEKKDAYQTFAMRPLDLGERYFDIQIRAPLYPAFSIGQTIEASGKISVPEFIYPHRGERGFDYASYLHTKNIGSQMLFPKLALVDPDAHTLPHMLGRWKEDMVSRVERYVASPASALASGMLFGNSSMSEQLVEQFRASGLSHIVVLSGFNIMIVITFVLFVFAFVPLVARVALASLFTILFVLMVGAEVSILRATIMSFFVLLAQLLGRNYVARQALMISFFLIIMYEPYALLKDASLHLSFLATAGIVYLSDPIKVLFASRFRSKTALELCATTSAAYVATLPYLMHTFHSVSVYALLANLAVIPLVPFAMLLSFLTVLASYLSETLARGIGYGETLIADIIIFISESIETLPLSVLSVSVSFFTMCLLYVLLSFLALYMFRMKKNETLKNSPGSFLSDTIQY